MNFIDCGIEREVYELMNMLMIRIRKNVDTNVPTNVRLASFFNNTKNNVVYIQHYIVFYFIRCVSYYMVKMLSR